MLDNKGAKHSIKQTTIDEVFMKVWTLHAAGIDCKFSRLFRNILDKALLGHKLGYMAIY